MAFLYGYDTKRVNETMRRNIDRFPEDFCFKLTDDEYEHLRSQIATSKIDTDTHGGRRYLPYVYSEHGILMLSGLLKNDIAINTSIIIMRAFVYMRKYLMNNAGILNRLTEHDIKLLEHDKKFDDLFNQVNKETNIKQKIFFNGQIYDAYGLIIDIIESTENQYNYY